MNKLKQIFGSLVNRISLITIYFTYKVPYKIPVTEIFREAFAMPYFVTANKYVENIYEEPNFYVIKIKSIKRRIYWPKGYPMESFLYVLTEIMNKNNWHYYQSSNTKVCKGDVVVDCGASEGLFTLVNEKMIKKSYLFEPSKYFIDALKKTFHDDPKKIEIINYALSDKIQTLDFSDNSVMGKIGENKSKSTKVKAITLDSYFYKKNIKIDFIKADIEGWEEHLLLGGQKTIKKFKPKIAITSYHPGNDYKKMVELILKIEPKYNYKIVGLAAGTKQPVMIHFWI
jgi:FkbM family methyltransferase